MRTVTLTIKKDKYKKDLLFIKTNTQYLCRQFDNNSTKIRVVSEDFDLDKFDVKLLFQNRFIPLPSIILDSTREFVIDEMYTQGNELSVAVELYGRELVDKEKIIL